MAGVALAAGLLGSNIVPSPKRKPAGTPASITAVDDESLVLFDADKLDGVGAIGIARALVFCGQLGLPPPLAIKWYEEKIATAAPLLRTKAGIGLARQQAEYVLDFIRRFKEEESKFVS